MTEPKPFAPVKLICGIIASEERIFSLSEQRLCALYGPVDLRSAPLNFDLTRYYEPQMGQGLKRAFLSFETLIAPERLSGIKIETNALEEDLRRQVGADRRAVNLDPGYLTRAALIMATAKDFSHRVPLEKGVYAHLEFLFHKDGIQILPWTYPDFRQEEYQPFFLEVRRSYLAQLGRLSPR